jgi:hypothetical protein
MIRFNFAAGILAFALFSYAQFSGWNLFDNEAGNQGQQLRSSGSGRSYHK